MSDAALSLPEGYYLRRYAAVGSTNDEAKEFARAGAPGGMLIWAEEQREGRGRRGRAWASPPGNLYLSMLLRPEGTAAHAAQLGFVAALGMGDALPPLAGPSIEIRYKWPNDLLANRRKLAGILLESETSTGAGGSNRVDFVVIGIGVNLLSAPAGVEYPATSLAEQGIAGITPAAVLQSFIRHFDRWVRRWREEGFAPVRAAWLARASGLGDDIRVRLDRSTLNGRFIDLDENGALMLDAPEGPRRIAAGEVFPALG